MSTPLFQPGSRVPRFAEAAVERARLTVVPRRAAVKAPRVPFVSLIAVLLVAGVAGLLLFNTNMQQASFVATSMEQQAAALAGQEESLRMQLHRLRDPQHIAAEAKKLGMVPAHNPAFLRLADGKVLGNPAVAQPTDSLRINPLPPAKPESVKPKLVIVEAPAVRRNGDRAEDAATTGVRDTTSPSGTASPEPAATTRTKSRNQDSTAEGTGRAR